MKQTALTLELRQDNPNIIADGMNMESHTIRSSASR